MYVCVENIYEFTGKIHYFLRKLNKKKRKFVMV